MKVRRALVLSLATGASMVLTVLVGGTTLPLPEFLSGYGVAVPLALLVPLVLAIGVAWALTAGEPVLEMVSSRQLRMLDASYAVLLALLTLGAGALVQVVLGAEFGLASGRNGLGYMGLTLIGRHLVGTHAAALVPVSFAVLASLFGGGPGREPTWWAWPFAGDGIARSWLWACGLLLAGAAAHVLIRPRDLPPPE